MPELLIEIGVEEMPAGISSLLVQALHDRLFSREQGLLPQAGIDVSPEEVELGCTPRRLIVYWPNCLERQPDHERTLWGPPERIAFDPEGRPTKAALGFARKVGKEVSDLLLLEKGDGKGRYLAAKVLEPGRRTEAILAEAMPSILRHLPSPKKMKWQDGEARDDAFTRPIRWIVALLGNTIIPFQYAGVESDRISFGHRIRGGSGEVDVKDPFAWWMERHVHARRQNRGEHQGRIERIAEEIRNLASLSDLSWLEDEELLEEVADLTEWPVPILTEFNEAYLRLPFELIRVVLKKHQRCFILRDKQGNLSNRFVAVANLESSDAAEIALGNARVVNARLADAAFYFDRDPKETLEARVEKLNRIILLEGLGTVGEQVARLRAFVLEEAEKLGADPNIAQRAALLCKSDLTTGLVGEFPELQGYIGGVYARINGEEEAVAQAIGQHYLPESTDDPLPESAEARAIGIAERLDKLLGCFEIGQIPTATADPYGLRRAAIGLIRLLCHRNPPVRVGLKELIEASARQWNQQGSTPHIAPSTHAKVHRFILDRFYHMAGRFGVPRAALEAAANAEVDRPMWLHLEVARILQRFTDSETGQAVAAAYKRMSNILKKAPPAGLEVNPDFFTQAEERRLYKALVALEAAFPTEIEMQVEALAALREPVDCFFDKVLVMSEDETVRINRLALLGRLQRLFLRLADISRL